MAKKLLEEARLSYGNAWLIQEHSPNFLVGRIMTLIDAIGLTSKQEESFKSLVKQEITKLLFEESIFIHCSLNNKIHEIRDQFRNGDRHDEASGEGGIALQHIIK